MAAPADKSAELNLLSGGGSVAPVPLWCWRDSRVWSGGEPGTTAASTAIVGYGMTLWQYQGAPCGALANPGAVAAPTNATTGACFTITNPTGGRKLWLLGGMIALGANNVNNNIAVVTLYDRLLHISGLDGTSVGTQTVGGSLTRYTDGVGNEIWAEINTQIGVTAKTLTATYTSAPGAASHTTSAETFGATNAREAQRAVKLRLAAGDTGVQGVTSCVLSGSTGTAGDFGIVVAHPIKRFTVPMTGYPSVHEFEFDLPNMPEIKDSACLSWMVEMPLVANVYQLYSELRIVEN